MKVYLVNQTQPEAEYYDKTIYVFLNKEDATNKARELNHDYGEYCDFTAEGDFIQVQDDYYFENVHYYTVEEIEARG